MAQIQETTPLVGSGPQRSRKSMLFFLAIAMAALTMMYVGVSNDTATEEQLSDIAARHEHNNDDIISQAQKMIGNKHGKKADKSADPSRKSDDLSGDFDLDDLLNKAKQQMKDMKDKKKDPKTDKSKDATGDASDGADSSDGPTDKSADSSEPASQGQPSDNDKKHDEDTVGGDEQPPAPENMFDDMSGSGEESESGQKPADKVYEHMSFKTKIVVPNADDFFCDDVKQYSGYINVSDDKNLFFWFFESRSEPSTDPVILWLTGGPGCSSMLALLSENGPCVLDNSDPEADVRRTRRNPFSWNSKANLLYIDQPAFVGYSYGASEKSFDRSSNQVAQDLSHFLLAFFARFPEYGTQPFYIFGESYGGHYVPALGHHLIMTPDPLHGAMELRERLAGLGIGNGMVDPAVQFKYYADYALYNKYRVMAQPNVLAQVRAAQDQCNQAVEKCGVYSATDGSELDESVVPCSEAFQACAGGVMTPIMTNEDPVLNGYDVRVGCETNPPLCYDFSREMSFLNHPDILARLGVEEERYGWQSCNTSVYIHLVQDYMVDYAGMILPMLQNHPNLRILAYYGDADFMCNWMGGRAWVMDLDWPLPPVPTDPAAAAAAAKDRSNADAAGTVTEDEKNSGETPAASAQSLRKVGGKSEGAAAASKPPAGAKGTVFPAGTKPGMGKFSAVARERQWFDEDGLVAGSVTGADRIAFLRFGGAGHMVPLDQPARSLYMLNRFLNNEHL